MTGKNDTVMERYLEFLDGNFADYPSLHCWSIEQPEAFWRSLIDFFQLDYAGSPEPVLTSRDFLDYPWFPDLRLNYAEHLLRHGSDNEIAIRFQHEGGKRRQLSWGKLRQEVAYLQAYLEPLLSPGDVIAAYMPNVPETLIAMLAASGLGAVFTSTSVDFGVESVLDRFGQCEPKVLVAAASYTYKGKRYALQEQVRVLQEKLPCLETVILVDCLGEGLTAWGGCQLWTDLQRGATPPPLFRRLPFSHPLFIMYSSGTTGKPKCIVHGAGGVLLQHLKELALHSDVSAGKVVHFFSTCAWMMWNWVNSSLALGAQVAIYDGAPEFDRYLAFLQEEEVAIWGTSPKYLKSLEQSEATIPALPSLACILSTGAPLLPEQFDYVYRAIKGDVRLSSISGGTDILGCFALGHPLLPVRRGELQCIGLGMDVAAFDEGGQPVIGETGELVCRQVFPSMPLGFWNDPQREKYSQAYFQNYPNVWCHGDFIRISDQGTVRILGRSDATLNPGGVRIGTAEIYRQVEQLPYVEDSVCVGKAESGDVDVLLFVKMREGEVLSDERIHAIKMKIRQGTTPRHVPKQVLEVPVIPYTPNGKKMELPISQLINGKTCQTLDSEYATVFLSACGPLPRAASSHCPSSKQ